VDPLGARQSLDGHFWSNLAGRSSSPAPAPPSHHPDLDRRLAGVAEYEAASPPAAQHDATDGGAIGVAIAFNRRRRPLSDITAQARPHQPR